MEPEFSSTKLPSSDTYEAAKSLWFSLPENKRTVRGVTDTLRERNYKVSKSTVDRWAKEWRAEPPPVDVAAQRMLLAPPASADEIQDVPQELREVLSPRLLALAKGKGLDRVEEAVVKLAEAICSRAPEVAGLLLETESETTDITKDGDQVKNTKVEKAKAARSVITAVATLAQAMQIVTASRAVTAMSHRNFAEGDLYMAQAEKARAEARLQDAEAQVIENKGRAEAARDVTSSALDITPDQEDEAVSALRDAEAR